VAAAASAASVAVSLRSKRKKAANTHRAEAAAASVGAMLGLSSPASPSPSPSPSPPLSRGASGRGSRCGGSGGGGNGYRDGGDKDGSDTAAATTAAAAAAAVAVAAHDLQCRRRRDAVPIYLPSTLHPKLTWTATDGTVLRPRKSRPRKVELLVGSWRALLSRSVLLSRPICVFFCVAQETTAKSGVARRCCVALVTFSALVTSNLCFLLCCSRDDRGKWSCS
jgi:hypothetical protein